MENVCNDYYYHNHCHDQIPSPIHTLASSYIASLLKESSTIEELSLSGCHGILISNVAEGLQSSKTITHFHLNNCGLIDDDIKTICNAVEHHPTLRTLTLDENNMMVDGFQSIFEMLKTNGMINNMGNLRALPEVSRAFFG